MGGREGTGVDTYRRSIRTAPFRKIFSAILWRVPAGTIGPILDFLVEDACVLCGGSHGKTPSTSEPIDPRLRFLLEPVENLWVWGRFRITNHPICVRCATGFDSAGTLGTLGLLVRPNRIELATGERFGAGAPIEDGGDRSAVAAGRERVEHIPVVAPFMTNDNTLKLIHLLKFGGYTALARPMGRAIGAAVREHAVYIGARRVVVPVPMDAGAHRRRGFNPAERIARELGADLGIPLCANLLQKTTRTRRQSKTPHELRADNVRGAFACRRGSGCGPVGKHVFLVDDLVTTGATAASCAAELLGAGADAVTVLSFGRAL